MSVGTTLDTKATLADPELGGVDEVVNLDRYRIDRPGSDEWRGLVGDVRSTLHTNGLVTLPDFLLPDALATAAAEIAALVPYVPIREQHASVYHRPGVGVRLTRRSM